MTIARYTPKGFGLIDFNSQNWHSDEWNNWTLLDALFTAAQPGVALPTVGGTANAITLDYPVDKVLSNGLQIVFMLTASPTGATTVNVDGTGVKALKILNTPVVQYDLVAGDIVTALYDGAAFQVLSPVRRAVAGPIKVTIAASGATADTTADELVLENSVHAGISILTPSTQKGTLAFGDPANALSGALIYDHATDTFSVNVNGTVTATLSATALRLARGSFLMDLTGANDFTITESSANVIRIGSSGSSNGIFIDIATGTVTMPKLGATTVTSNLTRDTKGVFPYFNDPLMTGGRIFMQAAGADPTSLPGDIVFEW